MSARAIKVATAFAALLMLAACGIKGPVEPPPDTGKTDFPRQYPKEKRPI